MSDERMSKFPVLHGRESEGEKEGNTRGREEKVSRKGSKGEKEGSMRGREKREQGRESEGE